MTSEHGIPAQGPAPRTLFEVAQHVIPAGDGPGEPMSTIYPLDPALMCVPDCCHRYMKERPAGKCDDNCLNRLLDYSNRVALEELKAERYAALEA